jgi:signal peptide peptidase SppA
MMHHLIAFALSQPWALRPEVMAAYAAILAQRVAIKEGLAPRVPRAMEDEGVELAGPTTVMSKVSGGGAGGGGAGGGGAIAVIPIRGTIVQRADQLGFCEGGTSTEDISQALRMAMADTTVGQVLLHIHSPGGSVYGVQELADEIREARKDKPVVSFASSLAASAAYWIGASAGEFYVTPGGEVGSIGVWSAHQNIKAYLEKEGIDIRLISAGKFKVEGHPYDALSDEAAAFMQSRVDDYYAAFTAAVAKGRNVPVAQVRDGMGQGRVLGAEAARAENMVDGVMTMDEVIRKMQRDAKAARPSNRSAQINREIEILSL